MTARSAGYVVTDFDATNVQDMHTFNELLAQYEARTNAERIRVERTKRSLDAMIERLMEVQTLDAMHVDIADDGEDEYMFEFISLAEAGIEEPASHHDGDSSVPNYREWFYDGECGAGNSDDY